MATSIEFHYSVEGVVGEGITLTEDQFEELQTVRQDISDRTDVGSDESDQKLRTNWPVQHTHCTYELQ